MIEGVRQQAFKESTVRSAFKKTGIIPYNPRVVLDQLEARANRTPSPVPQDHLLPMSSPFSTPVTLRQVNKVAEQILHEIDDEDFNPELRTRIEKMISAGQANTAELIATKRDLGRTKLATEARKARKAQRNTQLQSGGVLNIEEARHMVQKRQETELEQAQKIVDKAEEKQKRKAIKWREEAAKYARRWRRNGTLQPLYIVDNIGSGRFVIRA